MSEDEAAEDEEVEEDEEDDEDVARMIQLVRAAYKYLRANVDSDMEKFHKSVGYQLVLAQLKGWTGRVLQGFKWKRDSPELLLFFLELARCPNRQAKVQHTARTRTAAVGRGAIGLQLGKHRARGPDLRDSDSIHPEDD